MKKFADALHFWKSDPAFIAGDSAHTSRADVVFE